jgi:hypothetical protein
MNIGKQKDSIFLTVTLIKIQVKFSYLEMSQTRLSHTMILEYVHPQIMWFRTLYRWLQKKHWHSFKFHFLTTIIDYFLFPLLKRISYCETVLNILILFLEMSMSHRIVLTYTLFWPWITRLIVKEVNYSRSKFRLSLNN